MGVRQRQAGVGRTGDLTDLPDAPSPEPSLLLRQSALAAAVLALVAILLRGDIDAGVFSRPTSPTGPQSVVRRGWGDPGGAGGHVSEGSPAVFKVSATPAKLWACRNWSLGWLASQLPAVQAKLRPLGADPVFWYYAERQWMAEDPWFAERYPDAVPQKADYDERILGAEAFFGQLGHDGSRLYAAGPVEDVLPPKLLADIGAASAFFPEGGEGGEEVMNVWMGSANTTAAMHYDTSSNYYIPLQGRKRFTLLPPSVQSRGLYPALHPYYRHLRPAAVASVLGSANGIAQHAAGLREVVVGPGDVLFIPAFWFHQVETLDPGGALALNLWSPSAAFVLMERAFVMPVPFESNWVGASLSPCPPSTHPSLLPLPQ